MPTSHPNSDEGLPLEAATRIDAISDEFEAALKENGNGCLDGYVDRIEPCWRRPLVEELFVVAIDHLKAAGVPDPYGQLLAANPSLEVELEAVRSSNVGAATVSMEPTTRPVGRRSGLSVRCPHCHDMIDLIIDGSLMELQCKSCGGTFSLIDDAAATIDAATITRIAHFDLVERLGMGEFGTVWKARDTVLERTVAVKIPRREYRDPVSTEKFMREARAAAQLQHPNIVSTHEVGRDQETFYIVSEYVRGVSLSAMLSDQRFGVREAAVVAAKLADALEHAHSMGVIHRDVKPSNILIDDHGEPHLMDFGLAKRRENEIAITTEGAVLGTPAYMSPEQARGEAFRVDGRSDVYSLGVVLFQLLTGELPFRGSMRMLLHKVIDEDPPGPRSLDSHVPKDLDTICLKCMEKEPARRYGSARAFAEDLRHYLAGEPISARRIGPIGRTVRWAGRNRAVAALLAATMATLLAATIVSSYFGWRAAKNAARADQQAQAVTDTLYDSLVQEMRLTREVRGQGYGKTVRRLVDRAQSLDSASVDKVELRRQLVLSMGDFVAYDPVVISPTQGEPTTLCLNRNGHDVLVGFDNGRIVNFDATTGEQRGELDAFDKEVLAIAVTADDQRLIAIAEVGAARIFHRADADWKLDRVVPLGIEPSKAFISSDGRQAVVVTDNGLDVWDMEADERLTTLSADADWEIASAAFDVANRKLAASWMNRRADSVGWALWDHNTAELQHQVELPSLGNTYIHGIDVARHGGRLAIGFDEALHVYDLEDYHRTNLFGFDSTKAVALSPRHPYLAASNIRGQTSVWNWATNRLLAALIHPRHRFSLDDLAFSHDGSRLASSNADTVQVWNLNVANEKTVLIGHEGGIPCAAFHPNDRLLATGGKDDQVRFWNPSTGEMVRSLDVGEAVQALAYSADAKLLAVGGIGKEDAPHLRIIDAQSNEVIHQWTHKMGNAHSLAWAGDYLAGCGPHGVALWKINGGQTKRGKPNTGRPVRLDEVFQLDRTWCLATCVDADSQLMVWAAEHTSRLQAWDIADGQELQLHAPPMLQGWHGVAFLPDGESVIYVSETGVAEVWNVREDRHGDSLGEPGTFKAPHIALSPNGEWLAALTQPDAVAIWHLPTKQQVYALRPETDTIWSLAWDRAGEHLSVGQSSGGLAVWHLPIIREKLAEAGLAWDDPE